MSMTCASNCAGFTCRDLAESVHGFRGREDQYPYIMLITLQESWHWAWVSVSVYVCVEREEGYGGLKQDVAKPKFEDQ